MWVQLTLASLGARSFPPSVLEQELSERIRGGLRFEEGEVWSC